MPSIASLPGDRGVDGVEEPQRLARSPPPQPDVGDSAGQVPWLHGGIEAERLAARRLVQSMPLSGSAWTDPQDPIAVATLARRSIPARKPLRQSADWMVRPARAATRGSWPDRRPRYGSPSPAPCPAARKPVPCGPAPWLKDEVGCSRCPRGRGSRRSGPVRRGRPAPAGTGRCGQRPMAPRIRSSGPMASVARGSCRTGSRAGRRRSAWAARRSRRCPSACC